MGHRSIEPNGCGACGGFWKWFKPPHSNFFKDECNTHDSLYSIGGNSIDRYIADLLLLKYMLKKVSEYYYKRKPVSRYWFYVICTCYFIGVRLFGYSSFNYKNKNKMKFFKFLNNFYYKYYGNRISATVVDADSVSRVMAVKVIGTGAVSMPVYLYLNDVQGLDVPYFWCFAIAYVIMIPIVIALNSIFLNLFKRTFKEIVVSAVVPLALISWLLGRFGEGQNKGNGKKA